MSCCFNKTDSGLLTGDDDCKTLSGISQGGGGGSITNPTLASAVIPSAGTTMVLTFTNTTSPMHPSSVATGFTITTNTISATSASGLTITLTLGTQVLSGQTFTISYSPGNVSGGNYVQLLAFSNHAVTNNSTVTPPTLTSAVIPSAGTTLVLTFGTTVSPMKPASGATGFTITANSVASTSSSGFVITITLGTTVFIGATPVVSYSPGNVTGGDLVPLASFSNHAITNNSTQTLPVLPTTNLILNLLGGVDMFQDVAFTIPCTTTGDPLLGWKDQSVTGNHATNASSTFTFASTCPINSQPAAQSTTNAQLFFTGLNEAEITSFVVVDQTNAGTCTLPLFFNGTSPYHNYNGNGECVNYVSYTCGGNAESASTITGPSGSRVIGAIQTTTNYASYYNGTLGSVISNSSNALLDGIGYATWNGNTYSLQGYIAEVIIYNAALSGTPLADVKAYLQYKYGITQV